VRAGVANRLDREQDPALAEQERRGWRRCETDELGRSTKPVREAVSQPSQTGELGTQTLPG
jgi:hypothetical protein